MKKLLLILHSLLLVQTSMFADAPTAICQKGTQDAYGTDKQLYECLQNNDGTYSWRVIID